MIPRSLPFYSSSFFPFIGRENHQSPLLAAMASPRLFPCMILSLFATLFSRISAYDSYPLNCTKHINTCNASLCHINYGLQIQQIADFYSVNSSQFTSVSHLNREDYLITVPCSCNNVNGTSGYFYETFYTVQPNDTFVGVSTKIYSGQAFRVGGEEQSFIIGKKVSMPLLCGCVASDSQTIVTYTVQQGDTLSDIATLLSAKISNIESLNPILTQNPGFIDVGWVLFVPTENKGLPAPKKEHKWEIIIGIISAVSLLSLVTLLLIFVRKRRFQQKHGQGKEDPKAVSKSMSTMNRGISFQNQFLYKENIEDVTVFESDRPVIYSLEEIEEATNNFDETKKIGSGGYGSVFYGTLGGGQEVAVKKMRSNKSKEFFAELKVLCKVHHINVVELLGFASGDDHFYLVYEFVQNGSLSDHLHVPLLKGHQTLSWTARTQIALDAAKGIEYIHDHTKARYVHRDIKTSNILLDKGLRAKVADFGLAKLVGRSSDEELIATGLVGTPGYLPPESVKELQVTPKTDVFAFGVVLAELITGQRALIRDNKEPNKMRSLIAVMNDVFQDEDPESALEEIIDGNLRGSYPMEDVYKMAEIAEWCMSEDAFSRPKMREMVVPLSQIVMASAEWEASLGGNSQVFSELFNGR